MGQLFLEQQSSILALWKLCLNRLCVMKVFTLVRINLICLFKFNKLMKTIFSCHLMDTLAEKNKL